MGVLIILNASIVSSANFLAQLRYLSTLNNRKMRDARSFFAESLIVASWMMIACKSNVSNRYYNATFWSSLTNLIFWLFWWRWYSLISTYVLILWTLQKCMLLWFLYLGLLILLCLISYVKGICTFKSNVFNVYDRILRIFCMGSSYVYGRFISYNKNAI